jgi:hypothetical protein
LRLLLRKKGQGPRSDRIHPRGKRAGKHGTAGFGSSAPADASRQFGRQPLRAPLLKANDWLHTPRYPPDRPKEGHGRKRFSIVWSGLAMASITSKCFLTNPSDSVAAGHSKYSRSGLSEEVRMRPSRHRSYPRLADPQRVTRCVTAPSRVVPLPSSKGGRKVRLGRLPSRKPVTVGLTAIFASNDNDSATPRPRQWLSDLLFSLVNNPIVPVLPLGGGPSTTNPAIWFCHPDHRSRCDGGQPPRNYTSAPFLSRWPHWNRDSLHDRVAGSGLGAQSKAACLRMQGAAHHARYLCRHRVQKRGRLVSFGPVNEGGAPASRGGQQESSHRVPKLPRSPCPLYVLTGCLWDAVQLSLMPVWNPQDLLGDFKQLSRKAVASATVQFKRPAQQSQGSSPCAPSSWGREETHACPPRGKRRHVVERSHRHRLD